MCVCWQWWWWENLTIWLDLRGDCIIIHAKAQILVVQWQIPCAVWARSNEHALSLTKGERRGGYLGIWKNASAGRSP